MSLPRRQFLQALPCALASTAILTDSEFAAAQSAGPAAQSGSVAAASQPEKVAGIGGLFFRAHDPAALGRWYLEHLGIALTPTALDSPVWQQEAGPTVFSPFPETTHYFDTARMWMINFRVHHLDKLAAQLRAADIKVTIDPQTYPNGRFAHLHDPEGNPIELWQPA